ncbi:MAG TPA: hypothetical protein VKU38_08515 [Ktedonobacteraceae bacterium]|nr:hypothetical protein [Ktedonobacteraceae bacterium]
MANTSDTPPQRFERLAGSERKSLPNAKLIGVYGTNESVEITVYMRKDVDQLAREMQAFISMQSKTSSTFCKATEKDLRATVTITRVLFELRESDEATFARRLTWIKKNPDIFYVLKAEEQVIGYAVMLPLKLEKIEKILRGVEFAQEANADEIEEFQPGKTVSIYLMGIGVTPGVSHFEKRTYGARLVSGFMGAIVEPGKRGVIIDTLAARSDTPDGIRILKRGFTEIPTITHTRNFLIKVRQSGIPFVQEYKQALIESGQSDIFLQGESLARMCQIPVKGDATLLRSSRRVR